MMSDVPTTEMFLEICNNNNISSSSSSSSSNKLECFQQNFVALCHNCFFQYVKFSYVNILDYLNFHTLCAMRCHLDSCSYITVNILCFPFGKQWYSHFTWNPRHFSYSELVFHAYPVLFLDVHKLVKCCL
jgi:hypothetical protein